MNTIGECLSRLLQEEKGFEQCAVFGSDGAVVAVEGQASPTLDWKVVCGSLAAMVGAGSESAEQVGMDVFTHEGRQARNYVYLRMGERWVAVMPINHDYWLVCVAQGIIQHWPIILNIEAKEIEGLISAGDEGEKT